MTATPRLPRRPSHPERVCWGCPRYCPAAELACGNGSIRAPHPMESRRRVLPRRSIV